MLKRKTCASVALILGLNATPVLGQQTSQPEHHRAGMPSQAMPGGGPMTGAGMGAGSGAMMGAGGMPMMGGGRMMMGEEGMGGMRMMAAIAGHVEGRLAFLKTELKITDAQLPLWNKFADVVRESAKSTDEMMQGGMMSSAQAASLPDRLAMREKVMAARLEALRKLKAAIDPLYAALSDEQKKTADELMPGPMGMGMVMM